MLEITSNTFSRNSRLFSKSNSFSFSSKPPKLRKIQIFYFVDFLDKFSIAQARELKIRFTDVTAAQSDAILIRIEQRIASFCGIQLSFE